MKLITREYVAREYGTLVGDVFVPWTLIEALCEIDQHDSFFGEHILINDSTVATALTEAGYAVQRTKGGYYGTDELRNAAKAATE